MPIKTKKVAFSTEVELATDDGTEKRKRRERSANISVPSFLSAKRGKCTSVGAFS